MPRVISGDVRAYVAKLVEVSDVRHRGSKYTKARTRVRASDGGQESLQRLESNGSPPPTPSQLFVPSKSCSASIRMRTSRGYWTNPHGWRPWHWKSSFHDVLLDGLGFDAGADGGVTLVLAGVARSAARPGPRLAWVAETAARRGASVPAAPRSARSAGPPAPTVLDMRTPGADDELQRTLRPRRRARSRQSGTRPFRPHTTETYLR